MLADEDGTDMRKRWLGNKEVRKGGTRSKTRSGRNEVGNEEERNGGKATSEEDEKKKEKPIS